MVFTNITVYELKLGYTVYNHVDNVKTREFAVMVCDVKTGWCATIVRKTYLKKNKASQNVLYDISEIFIGILLHNFRK